MKYTFRQKFNPCVMDFVDFMKQKLKEQLSKCGQSIFVMLELVM